VDQPEGVFRRLHRRRGRRRRALLSRPRSHLAVRGRVQQLDRGRRVRCCPQQRVRIAAKRRSAGGGLPAGARRDGRAPRRQRWHPAPRRPARLQATVSAWDDDRRRLARRPRLLGHVQLPAAADGVDPVPRRRRRQRNACRARRQPPLARHPTCPVLQRRRPRRHRAAVRRGWTHRRPDPLAPAQGTGQLPPWLDAARQPPEHLGEGSAGAGGTSPGCRQPLSASAHTRRPTDQDVDVLLCRVQPNGEPDFTDPEVFPTIWPGP
jgi:hypothetical protein